MNSLSSRGPRRLAIAVRSLSLSQKTYRILRGISSFLQDPEVASAKIRTEITIFLERLHESDAWPPSEWRVSRDVPVLPFFELSDYSGTVIACDVSSARAVLGRRNRVLPGSGSLDRFLAFDLEWLRRGPDFPALSYREAARIWASDRLPLLVRSREHAAIVTKCWNPPTPPTVIEADDGFDFRVLSAIVFGENTGEGGVRPV